MRGRLFVLALLTAVLAEGACFVTYSLDDCYVYPADTCPFFEGRGGSGGTSPSDGSHGDASDGGAPDDAGDGGLLEGNDDAPADAGADG